MSLLIKALQKAEEEKTGDGNVSASLGGLSLEPISTADQKHATGPTLATDSISRPQQAAAGVFSAKQPSAANRTDPKKLLLIGVAVLLLVLLIGMQVYSYLDALDQPQVVVPRPLVAEVQSPPPAIQSQVMTEADGTASPPVAEEGGANAAAIETPATATETRDLQPTQAASAAVADESAASKAKPDPIQTDEVVMGSPVTAPEEGSLQITRNPVEVGISPDLTAAYLAFNAGDDAKAQYHYRKVLQSDVRNTDALLGMAGIAARQGRMQDAAGWYAKVLEVDPRNTIAQGAMASGYAQVDPVGAESRIKNLLAQKPEAAHLHAALGSLFAERGNWPEAQQSYFQAYHFAPANADYAFNLAISLDHMGKPALALQYYKQAQALLPSSGSGNIERAQLESRILQLQ